MWKNSRVILVLFVAPCLVAGVANDVASGEENRPAGDVRLVCEAANAAAEARYLIACNEWQKKVADLRTKDRLKRFGQDAAGFDEKLSQAFDLAKTSSEKTDRMKESLRGHVVDERAFAQSMVEAFGKYQKALIAESTALYGQAGIDPAAAEKAFPPATLDPAPMERAFDPVIAKARSLANEDWFRFGLVNVGSDIVANEIFDFGRSNGLWNPEKGSVEEFLGGLITQVAVEIIAEELTDPSDTFARHLQVSMVNAERELLNGPSGLLTALRKLTTSHQQGRLKQLGLVAKGGK